MKIIDGQSDELPKYGFVEVHCGDELPARVFELLWIFYIFMLNNKWKIFQACLVDDGYTTFYVHELKQTETDNKPHGFLSGALSFPTEFRFMEAILS